MKYRIYLIVLFVIISLSGCSREVKKENFPIEGNYSDIQNGELQTMIERKITIKKVDEKYQLQLVVVERRGDMSISPAFSGDIIEFSPKIDFSKLVSAETENIYGSSTKYYHQFVFEQNQIKWRYILEEDKTDKKKAIEKEKFVTLNLQ